MGKLIKEKKLGDNVIFLIEGNEETGSPYFKKFIEKNKKDLRCDCVVISDGELARGNSPALEESFRGVANLEILLETAKDDLHYRLLGGAVPNAAEELSRLVSKFHNEDKSIVVSGFYDGLGKIKNGKEAVVDFRKLTGTKIVFAKNQSQYENRTGLSPAIEVTGLISGYTGEGFKNSIPSKARAKINIRSAPSQDPEKLFTTLKKFVLKNKPAYTRVKVTNKDTSSGAILNLKNKFSQKAGRILKMVYNKNPVTVRSGGTVPIVNHFQKILGVPQVMIPLANEDCGMHSASENITLDSIKKGLAFSSKFFGK